MTSLNVMFLPLAGVPEMFGNEVVKAVGKNHPPPGPVVLPRQPPEVTEELGVDGARFFGLVDQPL